MTMGRMGLVGTRADTLGEGKEARIERKPRLLLGRSLGKVLANRWKSGCELLERSPSFLSYSCSPRPVETNKIP
jgi:hypothetical protein